ncbi:cobalt-precorrin-6A reductase [Methyloceanibacter sp. wino2]|uniref:cobalt-precorrin-6A reductase n=1 Tax=Methyloceanibacter sp. wino2 TaxID=2170729 RepID=UPI000D3E036B|nr:cobalt-precorrin-6A reductase [Methyloceanibacter sp. wino2]
MNILILGGTTESRKLAGALDARGDVEVTLSLAGSTAAPRAQGVPTRVGGFGGAEGLAGFIQAENIGMLIDATHPYADRISANAELAAEKTGVSFLALRRAPWVAVPGDRWIEVATVAEAAAALGPDPVRVFLALGRKDIAPFESAPQHTYLVRSVDPIDPPLAVPNAEYVTARGPFSEADDRGLLEQHGIEVVVSKNSGGEASYGKIAAARALHLPVVMIRRPDLPEAPSVATVSEALAWCDHALTVAAMRGV